MFPWSSCGTKNVKTKQRGVVISAKAHVSDSSFCPKVVKIFKIPEISQEYLSKISGMSWILSMKFVFDIHVVFIIHWINLVLFSPTNWLWLTFHFRFLLEEKTVWHIAGLRYSLGRGLTLRGLVADDSAYEWFWTLAFLPQHLLWS